MLEYRNMVRMENKSGENLFMRLFDFIFRERFIVDGYQEECCKMVMYTDFMGLIVELTWITFNSGLIQKHMNEKFEEVNSE